MSAVFVTAIGTEIGKTYVSARLLKGWRKAGHRVHAVKPVMSGFGEDALLMSDAGQLLQACGETVSPQSVSGICLHRFEAPLAPNVAMRRAGVEQDYGAILDFTRRQIEEAGAHRMIVEGAGGVMSASTPARPPAGRLTGSTPARLPRLAPPRPPPHPAPPPGTG